MLKDPLYNTVIGIIQKLKSRNSFYNFCVRYRIELDTFKIICSVNTVVQMVLSSSQLWECSKLESRLKQNEKNRRR